jgi:hypothetical protein
MSVIFFHSHTTDGQMTRQAQAYCTDVAQHLKRSYPFSSDGLSDRSYSVSPTPPSHPLGIGIHLIHKLLRAHTAHATAKLAATHATTAHAASHAASVAQLHKTHAAILSATQTSMAYKASVASNLGTMMSLNVNGNVLVNMHGTTLVAQARAAHTSFSTTLDLAQAKSGLTKVAMLLYAHHFITESNKGRQDVEASKEALASSVRDTMTLAQGGLEHASLGKKGWAKMVTAEAFEETSRFWHTGLDQIMALSDR